MSDKKDRTDEAPKPTEDLGLPTPPSPGRVPPPTCRPLQRTTPRPRNRRQTAGREVGVRLRGVAFPT